FISETRLQATIPPTDLAAAGAAKVSVSNPAPGGGVSAAVNFLIATGITPVINAAGVVNSASYTTAIAPGGIAAVFGVNLATSHAHADTLPLPAEMGGVMVLVDGVPAALFDVTSTQVTFQVPWR